MKWLVAFNFLGTDINPDKGFDAVFDIIAALINFSLFMVGGIAVVMVIIGGLLYVTSQGDPKRTARAKKTIYFAIGGVLLSLSALVIVRFAQTLFGTQTP